VRARFAPLHDESHRKIFVKRNSDCGGSRRHVTRIRK
jgi:hypothetical protein